MKKALFSYFGVHILLYTSLHISDSHQACSPPDAPDVGAYFPKMKLYEPGEEVIYNCSEDYILMGEKTSKCKSNGEWSDPTPFCDLKAQIKNAFASNYYGHQSPHSTLVDGDVSTCFTIGNGESIAINLDRPAHVHAIRLYAGTGMVYIDILSGENLCSDYVQQTDNKQWNLIQCSDSNASVSSVRIQNKEIRPNENSTVCEVEIFVRGDDECEYPPEITVPNGHFNVTRTVAQLICHDGYEIQSHSGRLVCDRNKWIGSRLQCSEILCGPLPTNLAPGTNWIVDLVKKISAGTRARLLCGEGYERIGGPETIVCQINGSWTFTNASCAELATAELNTKNIIFAVVGTVAALIIVSLLAVTIYFKKRHRREIIATIYKPPTEGSTVSGYDDDNASGYYESMQSVPPELPMPRRPTGQMMLTDSDFTRLNSHDSLKKQTPIPPYILFDNTYETMSG